VLLWLEEEEGGEKKGIFQVKKEYAYLQFVYTGAVLR
jgi:hypothetical protein